MNASDPVLVTGAMGHVGYETVRQAAAQGLRVVAQYHRTFREADAAAVGPGVEWVRCDLSDPFAVAMLVGGRPLDGIIHSAAIANDKTGLPVPRKTFASNVQATALLLDAARERALRRFLFVSTGAVFQEWKDCTRPIPESEPPTPRTLYGGTKRCGEIMTEVYANVYGLSAAVMRISWVFGPPLVPRSFEGPRGPVPEFLRRALAGERIDEPTGGDFAASFTYITDVALGLLAAYRAGELAHRSYHVGSGRNHSTAAVIDAVNKAVPGADARIGPGTEPWTQFTVLRGPLACERMREEFGFVPQHTLDSAVQAFADWMRANPEGCR